MKNQALAEVTLLSAAVCTSASMDPPSVVVQPGEPAPSAIRTESTAQCDQHIAMCAPEPPICSQSPIRS